MTGRIVRYLPQLAFASDSDVEPVLRYVDPYVSLTLTFHFPTTSFVEIAGVGPLLRYPSLCSFNRSGSTPELRARRPQLPVGVCHQRFQDGLPSPSPTPYFTTYKRVRVRGRLADGDRDRSRHASRHREDPHRPPQVARRRRRHPRTEHV